MAEESTDEVQRSLRELQEELSELNALRNHRGYKKLLLIAEEQVNARISTIVLVPLETSDGVLKQEYAKGEIHGIRLFMAMTDAQIDLIEAEMQPLLEKEKDNATSTNDDSTAGT